MNRRRADLVAGALVGAVLLGGGALTWQAYRQRRALDGSMGSMMDTGMGAMHGPNPLWLLLGTGLVAAIVGGLYVSIRATVSAAGGDRRTAASPSGETARPSVSSSSEGTESSPSSPSEDGKPPDAERGSPAVNPEAQPRARVLDLLPDDERRVLEPVLSSPGITQIELRDRSGFSKSKVSQTVSDLEARGLLYRERQGRTYRIYPSEELQTADN